MNHSYAIILDDSITCLRNADLRVCSDNVADLASRFCHFLIPVDFTICSDLNFMMFFYFRGCLCTSTGCLDDVSLLYFLIP